MQRDNPRYKQLFHMPAKKTPAKYQPKALWRAADMGLTIAGDYQGTLISMTRKPAPRCVRFSIATTTGS